MEDWIYTCYPNENPNNIYNMAAQLLSENKNQKKGYAVDDLLRNYELGLKENAAGVFAELKMLGFEDEYLLEIEKWRCDKSGCINIIFDRDTNIVYEICECLMLTDRLRFYNTYSNQGLALLALKGFVDVIRLNKDEKTRASFLGSSAECDDRMKHVDYDLIGVGKDGHIYLDSKYECSCCDSYSTDILSFNRGTDIQEIPLQCHILNLVMKYHLLCFFFGKMERLEWFI
eukprot:UN22935